MTETLNLPLKKRVELKPAIETETETDFDHEEAVQEKRKYVKKDRKQEVYKPKPENRICFDCGNNELYQDSTTGDLVCTVCGLVVDSHLFSEKTGQSFNGVEGEAAKTIVKAKLTVHGEKLAKRIQKAEKWTHNWAEIHKIIVAKEINRYTYNLDLPSYMADHTQNLYEKVYKKNAIQGRGIKAMVAACAYITCRLHKIPIFFSDIERVSKQEHSTIRKCFTYIMENFQIRLPVLDAKQFIPRLANHLELPKIVEKVAMRIINKLDAFNWGQKVNNPKHYAAISLFLAYKILENAEKLNVSITQKEFSVKVGMSETTLRKYRTLLQQAIVVKGI